MRERGSAVVEVVLVVPLMMMLLFFVVAAGRLMQAHNDVVGAAGDAARAASMRRQPGAMAAAARTVAHNSLREKTTTCKPLEVRVDGSGAGDVIVEVSCTTRLSDLGLLGLPGSRRVTARAIETIDHYRGS